MSRYLVDKSVLARAGAPGVAVRLGPLVASGSAMTCAIIVLEVLFSARSGAEHQSIRRELAGFTRLAIDDTTFDRAIEVQGGLAERGSHRGVSLPDLLIAACAEAAGVTVLHYDSDFDRIAAATGQATEWVAERGSVD